MVLTREAEGEFVQPGPADNDGTCLLETTDNRRRPIGRLAVERGTCSRCEALLVDQILDGEWDSGQEPLFLPGMSSVVDGPRSP